jgi:hypothetical protein
MINSRNFIIPPTYMRLFYPWMDNGMFMGRRYIINLSKMQSARTDIIKSRTTLRPIPNKTLSKTNDNVFFSLGDLYENFKPIIERFAIMKVYTEFFPELYRIIDKLTPAPTKESKDKECNNRLLIIDAASFSFKPGAPLKENQSNPLFLIYLAYLRSRDLSTLNLNRDMLICSGNMFIKFNPASMTPDKWPQFKLALFKIMNANLDDYTAQLTDEEKTEVEKSAEGHLIVRSRFGASGNRP